MKKNLYFSIFAGALLICSCQNELYKDATSEYRSAQGAYIKTGESSEVYHRIAGTAGKRCQDGDGRSRQQGAAGSIQQEARNGLPDASARNV